MSRYLPSTTYLHAAIVAFVFAGVSGYIAQHSFAALVPAILLITSSACLFYLYSRPAIEIHPTHVVVGQERYTWNQIRLLEHSGWLAPLVVKVGLQDKSEFRVIYPGDLESATMLLREMRLHAESAMIDGVPHREYWRGEAKAQEATLVAQPRAAGSVTDKPKYPLLSPGEEDEVERLYQRLKKVGHLDSKDEQ